MTLMDNKIFTKIFNLSAYALIAAVIVYTFILTTLHQGISCDEGFYLMGYLHNQPLGSFISDYANLVRAITPQGWEENIMVYRYERLILFLLSITLFAVSLYKWLKQQYGISINKVLFFSLVFMAGAMSYTFASPTISYDSIQTIIYLISFSLLFFTLTSRKKWQQNVLLLITGAISIVSVFNYLPSGLFLIFTISCCVFLFYGKPKFQKWILYILGILIGIIAYHFFVRDLVGYAEIAYNTVVSALTEKSLSRHDSGSLIKSFLIKLGLFLIFIPAIYLFSVLFRKIKINKTIYYSLLVVATIFYLIYRKIYNIYAPLFFVPIALLIAGIISESTVSLKSKENRKEFIFLTLLLLLPFFATFGTNQNLFAKMLIFLPFWMIIFFIMLSKVKNLRLIQAATLLMLVTLFAGYVYLGNFSRYHYYYTPRSSKFPIENIERKQKITISKFQQAYYREIADTLKAHGAQKSDKYLAFGENQMTVFLMGGYVSGNLPYHWFQYENFPEQRPKFFVLFKNEEQEVIDLLKNTNWNFPYDYRRNEMRAMSENMDQEELKTVIYALKE